ncbi:hypothetical protein [Kitasatospora sp. NBC_00315]|uniref:hypothetical protein n=1 Tax=Kitasatospora sp. NBC_00315 TaxID=2975963 RepID=UPI0032446625
MRTRLLAATLTATAALTLAACSSSGDPSAAAPSSAASGPSTAATTTPAADSAGPATDPAGTTPPPDPAAPPATAKPSPPADAGLPPAPDPATVTKLAAALDAIDPGIVAGASDKAADRARNLCQSIYQFPKDKAKLVDLANQRFTSADHPSGFGPDKAARILDAVRATVCPTS